MGRLFLDCIKVFCFFFDKFANALVSQKYWWKIKRCYLLGVVLLAQVQTLMCVSLLCEVLSDVLVMMIVSCIKGGKRKYDGLHDGGKIRV